ncbi:TetR/AcrR family transcriptional regulator [Oleomonas cavernae]|nr:TetR/AcrR family transcriptional regulator [Oleomonas cavernae]
MTTEPGKRGRPPSPEKREAIVAAALEAFARQGVDAATTREIAAAAGTTERTLFKHFGSKQGLVQAALAAAVRVTFRQPAFDGLREDMSAGDFVAWHRDFLAERAQAAARSPEMIRLLLAEILRDAGFRESLKAAWMSDVFTPLARRIGRLRASAFFSLNLGYIITSAVLAPEGAWAPEADAAEIAGLFATLGVP